MADKTVIYFTSNREEPGFEGRIMRKLEQTAGDIPIVSVSQKPIELGTNICVGESEPSTRNALNQLLIGAKEAKTRFVCLAESDFIYPKEYFDFTPASENIGYLAAPVYVLFAQRGKARLFARKVGGCDSAMVVGRECLIDSLVKALSGEVVTFLDLLKNMEHSRFLMTVPAVTFKTSQNMHRKTPFSRSSVCRELPGIGNSADLIKEYMG